MGRSDQLRDEPGTVGGTLNRVEAFAGIAFCALYADKTVTAEEEDDLQGYLWKLRAFRDHSELQLQEAFDKVYDIAEDEGVTRLLERCVAELPDELKPTAYFVATDLAMGDGAFVEAESAFLHDLRTRLGLNRRTTETIREALAYKHRG